MNKMKTLLAMTVLSASLVLTACGGSGGGSSTSTGGTDLDTGGGGDTTAPTPTLIGGKVIDGYVSGATVFLDENNNGVLDGTEISTETDDTGSYVLDVPYEKSYCATLSPVVVDVPVGAVDLDKGVVTEAYQMVLPPMLGGVDSTLAHITPLTSDIFKEAGVTASCDEIVADSALQQRVDDAVTDAVTKISDFYGVDPVDLFSDVTLKADLQAIADRSVLAKQQEVKKTLEIFTGAVKNGDDGQNYEDLFGVNIVRLLSVSVTYTPWHDSMWVETITRQYSATNTKTVMVSLVDSDFEYTEDDRFTGKSLTEEKSIKDGKSSYTIAHTFSYLDNAMCDTDVSFEYISQDSSGFDDKTYSVTNTYSDSMLSQFTCMSYVPAETDLDGLELSIVYPSTTGHDSTAVYSYDGSDATGLWATELVNLSDYNSIYINDSVVILDESILTTAIDGLNYEFDNSDYSYETSIVKTEDTRVNGIHVSLYKEISLEGLAASIYMKRTTFDIINNTVVVETSDDEGVTWTPSS